MGESDLHSFLKSVAAAWLSNQGCFLVADEVEVMTDNKMRVLRPFYPFTPKDSGPTNPVDNKIIVDVVGAGYNEVSREKVEVEEYKGKYEQPIYRTEIHKKWLLRGVEVKVSKNDFKNGYSCSGCNFNYLLVPRSLVSGGDLSKEVGLITFDKDKFHPFYERATNHFILEGVRLVKRAVYQDISDDEAISKMAQIAYRQSKRMNIGISDVLRAGVSHRREIFVFKTPEGYTARVLNRFYKKGVGETEAEAIKNLMDALTKSTGESVEE